MNAACAQHLPGAIRAADAACLRQAKQEGSGGESGCNAPCSRVASRRIMGKDRKWTGQAESRLQLIISVDHERPQHHRTGAAATDEHPTGEGSFERFLGP